MNTTTNKTMATLAVALVATLGITACNGAGSSSKASQTSKPPAEVTKVTARPPRTSTPTTTTTTTTEPAGHGRAALRSVNYWATIPTPVDVTALMPPSYFEVFTAEDSQKDLDGYTIRSACGRQGEGSSAGGVMQEFVAMDGRALVAFTVESFEGDEAAEAFEATKATAQSCGVYSDKNGNQLLTLVDPDPDTVLAGLGDDRFGWTARDMKTGVLVADGYVRVGQFVYEIRVVGSKSIAVGASADEAWRILGAAMKQFVPEGDPATA